MNLYHSKRFRKYLKFKKVLYNNTEIIINDDK